MEERILTESIARNFHLELAREEKSSATIRKYLRDIRKFACYARSRPITRELVAAYKQDCTNRGYAISSINSMLASVNSLLMYLGWQDCRVKNIRCQRQTYCAESRELTKEEYRKLLESSRKDERLNLVLQTLCGTGIRVSELRYFTVEALRQGEITVTCKNKTRTILVPEKLRKMLLNFAKKRGIHSGAVFVTRSGADLDRSNIWHQMKALCKRAGIEASKVFPHNLRKLFARTFYNMEKDIAKLADILGHSSINTTRIYIMTTGREHRRKIERLGLIIEKTT